MSQQRLQPTYEQFMQEDEIDLFELVQTLWENKIIITVFVLLTGLLSAIYAYTAAPVYRAEITLQPPSRADIANYNENSFISKELSSFRAQDVYQIFLGHLRSESLRIKFFREVYLPQLAAQTEELSEQQLYLQFEKRLDIRKSDAKNLPNEYVLSLEFSDAHQAASLLDAYLAMAADEAKRELRAAITSQSQALAAALKLELDRLKSQAENQRLDDVERVTDALYVAESIKLENPSQLTGKFDASSTTYTDNNPLYLQGSKALKAQLKVLNERKNNEAYIRNYREIESRWHKLRTLQIDDSAAKVVSYESERYIADQAIKPRKLLIMAIGLLVGGLLGVVFVLMRNIIAERKASTGEAGS